MSGIDHAVPRDPLIFSFVSGKGGVGKTMLAVAFAKELSKAVPTLLVDLDFFNRGLTALLPPGDPVATVDHPDFPNWPPKGNEVRWQVVRVDENLFHLDYPDLTQAEMNIFATLETERLTQALDEFIHKMASQFGCQCVIIDCHGGPDHTSFAACVVADHAILVSEPDRITFHGTLNFMRQLHGAVDADRVDLRLIFNKVVPSFSGLHLQRFYDRTIRPQFADKPLLGMFPLEVYLTKEFERTPFLTAAYPYSLLARKTRLALYDLLHPTRRDALSRMARTMPVWMRAYRRVSLGKRSFLIDPHIISAAIAVLVVTGVAISAMRSGIEEGLFWASLDESISRLEEYFERFGVGILLTAAVWLAAAIFHYWTRDIGRRFTRCSRLRRYGAMAGYGLCAVLIWLFPITILVTLVAALRFEPSAVWGIAILSILFVSITVEQFYKGCRELVLEGYSVEPLLRVLFAAGIFFPPLILSLVVLIDSSIG